MPTPIIDIFAGPGGLGEGFSSYRPRRPDNQVFKIHLSIEMNECPHQTLQLRSLYRQFVHPGDVPATYYKYLRGDTDLEHLQEKFPEQFAAAQTEACRAELGIRNPDEISSLIEKALGKENDNWLLIGGPPCQAYSLAGRSRIIAKKGRAEFEKDHRHFLYREYLRIIARHQPAVFVMENVKGLLAPMSQIPAPQFIRS